MQLLLNPKGIPGRREEKQGVAHSFSGLDDHLEPALREIIFTRFYFT
jgi:hypothetical protein